MSGFLNRLFRRRKTSSPSDEFSLRIAQLIGESPRDLSYYHLAVRHSSASMRSAEPGWANNERLEFLGDAILGAVVAEYLYHEYPEESEGFLTGMRAKVVSRKTLNHIAAQLDLKPLVISKLPQTKSARSLLGDVLEALIGAVYLDLGIESAKRFITEGLLKHHVNFTELEGKVVSFKSTFIEYVQAARKSHSFRLEDKWGENHNLTFKIGLYLQEERIAEGVGTSKKRAEEMAAEKACIELKLLEG